MDGMRMVMKQRVTGKKKEISGSCLEQTRTEFKDDNICAQIMQRGKARMREYGNVSIPQEAFIAALRMGEE